MKEISVNKKLYHDYEIFDTYEAGIELKGCEVKSIREGKIDIKDAFCIISKGEIWLINSKISPYSKATTYKLPIDRKRKLLLHKQEINRLTGKVSQKGFTIKPSRVYFNNRGFVKIEIVLCKPKKLYDKREKIKQRDLDRENNVVRGFQPRFKNSF